jgi:hypothetical protein
MHMTKSDMVTILSKWKLAQTCADEGIEPLYQLFGCNPDAPVMDAFYRLAAAHTEVVSQLVGDVDGWLNWFQFDNEMGAKAFEASPPNGKVRKVRTLAHLAALIIESRPA